MRNQGATSISIFVQLEGATLITTGPYPFLVMPGCSGGLGAVSNRPFHLDIGTIPGLGVSRSHKFMWANILMWAPGSLVLGLINSVSYALRAFRWSVCCCRTMLSIVLPLVRGGYLGQRLHRLP